MAGSHDPLSLRPGNVSPQHCFSFRVGQARLEASPCSISWPYLAGRLPARSWHTDFVNDQKSDRGRRRGVFCEPHPLHVELVYRVRQHYDIASAELHLDRPAHGKLQQRHPRPEGRGLLCELHFSSLVPHRAPDGIPAVEVLGWPPPGLKLDKLNTPRTPAFTSSSYSRFWLRQTFWPIATTSPTTPPPTSSSVSPTKPSKWSRASRPMSNSPTSARKR